MNALVVWVAQGFYIGRIPGSPGTFGSLLGLVWVAALLSTGALWAYVLGSLLGIAASVWFCGEAERILGRTDPGSVVLDEIAAIPLCFGGTLAGFIAKFGHLPPPSWLIARETVWWTVGTFIAFRVFDIAKPWPVRQSQQLPGGWGVTVDDLLAAVYVNLTLFVATLLLT